MSEVPEDSGDVRTQGLRPRRTVLYGVPETVPFLSETTLRVAHTKVRSVSAVLLFSLLYNAVPLLQSDLTAALQHRASPEPFDTADGNGDRSSHRKKRPNAGGSLSTADPRALYPATPRTSQHIWIHFQ